MLKITFACYLGIIIFSHFEQFTFEICVAVRNREKFTKTLCFRGSRSFKAIDVNTLKKLVASDCYNMQHVYILYFIYAACKRFHAIRVNSSKIRTFRKGYLFLAFVRQEPLHPAARNFVKN